MKNLAFNLFSRILKKVDYFLVITGLFSYLLGCSVADFLGTSLDFESIILGLFLLLSIYITFIIIDLYFEGSYLRENSKPDQKTKIQLIFLLALIAIFLFLIAFLIFLIQSKIQINLETWLFLGTVFFFSILLVLPKLKNDLDPFSLFIKSFMVSALIPAIALLLQRYELNRILSLLALPLFFLHAASSLARSFSRYASDLSKKRQTTLVSLGWEKGIFFHNIMVLLVFLLLGLEPLFGLAWKVIWPALTTGIVGLFQIFQLQKIAQGGKPNWLLLNWTALILYAAIVYMLMFAFFIY